MEVQMKTKNLLLVISLIPAIPIFIGCATTGAGRSGDPSKKLIQTSYREGEEPTWVRDSRISWEEGENRVFKSSYVVPGNRRVNGCFDLARAETKEHLLTEIASDVRGEFVRASQGLDEAIDENTTKTWVEKFSGETRGLRFVGQVYERFLVNENEKVECFVIAQIAKADYQALRSRVYNNAVRTNERVRKALEDRQVGNLLSDAQATKNDE
jgi:hypothetical protein